jgi:predicted DsbA family dithiol-disulfide isomerase
VHIDAVYDFLCPWCFVGKRHLDLAIAQEQPAGLSIRWHQFMLYPHFDRGGHDFLEFFRSKYGDQLRVPMWDAIRAVATPIGINFAFEQMTRGPASIDGHRIVRWAERRRPGVAAAMIEDLSSSFFEQAKVIDDDFLVALAERHGFDGAAARAHIASEIDLKEPFAENDAWRARGVQGMPLYILTLADGRQEVIQQTSVDAFVQAFQRDQALSPVATTQVS